MDSTAERASATPSVLGPRLRVLLRQGFWFVLVGVLATGLNALLYLLARQWLDLVVATVLAVALSTVASSEANRLLTFAGIAGRRASLDTQSVLVFLFYAFYNTLALGTLHLFVPGATPQTESIVLFLVSGLGGLARFLALRSWVFRGHPSVETEAAAPQAPAETAARTSSIGLAAAGASSGPRRWPRRGGGCFGCPRSGNRVRRPAARRTNGTTVQT